MENAFAQGDRTQAFILLGDLERQYPSSPYADQARLASARAFVEDGELGRAADELRAGHAALRRSDAEADRAAAAGARADRAASGCPTALATLNGADPGALAPQYAAVRGDAYYAMGDKAAALAQYRLAPARPTPAERPTPGCSI